MHRGGPTAHLLAGLVAVKVVVGMLLWLPVVVMKTFLVVLGLVAVPLTSPLTGMWRAGDRRPHTYWERAIRNPVGGFDHLMCHPMKHYIVGRQPGDPALIPDYEQIGAVAEAPFTDKHWQWEIRHHGLLVMFRCLWQYPKRERYGEFFIGWKLGYHYPLLDFAMQFRPWARVGN